MGESRGGAAGTLSAPVLVARDQELATLVACVESAPAIAVVEGEAGVGKTRLVAEVLASPAAAGRLVLVGRCHPLRDPFPLGPVIEALRGVGHRAGRLSLSPLAGALRPLLPELADHLPSPPDPLADPRMERHRLWRAVVELLGAVGPAVVVLEDLHWADEATAEFLVFLAGQLPAGVVVLLTWRPAELAPASPLPGLATRPVGPATATRVALAPLEVPALKALVNAILGSDDISDEFVAYLHERTAGIPFAVEEVLRLLQDRHDLVRWEGRWARRSLDRLEVPAAIRESIRERVAGLDPGPRQVVEAAAVIGQPADEALLASVVGLSSARATTALVGALEAALLQEGPEAHYGFRHALATDAVYAAIAAPTRRRLHQRAARAMEEHGEHTAHAQLARHHKEGGQPLKWVLHARQAAVDAAALGDHAAAAAFLLDAMSAPRLPAATRGELAIELSIAAIDGLTHVDALTAVAVAVDDRALPATLRGKLAFNLGSLLHQAGDASGSRAAVARAVPQLRGEPALQSLAMSALASPWVIEGDFEEHLKWLDRADTIAAQHDLGEVEVVLRGNRASVLSAVGEPSASRVASEPPAPDASEWDRVEWVRVCTNLAVNSSYLGHYDVTRRWVSEGNKASEALGADRLGSSLRATTLMVRWATGDWDGLADEATELEGEALDVPSAVQASVVRGLLDLAVGRVEEAQSRLGHEVERAARCGAIPTMAMACAGLTRLLLSRAEAEAARATALRALSVVAAKDIWVWAASVAPSAIEALVACGRAEEARQWTRSFTAGLAGRDAPAAAAAVAHCEAVLAAACGEAAEAVPLLMAAQEAWAVLACPYEAAQVAERRGRGLIHHDREGGGAALLEALDAFRGLGASWDEARVRHELRRHRIALPYPFRGGRPKRFDDVLSPREQEVLELAATGATSTRIAERLFLSPRTVDHHIERALRKLGLASRQDLVAARQAGRDPLSNIG